MKRFIGYLLLSLSILVSVFIGFVPTFSNINASGDFSRGKEFIYQVSVKNENNDLNYINGDSSFKSETELNSDIDDVVNEFKSRLENIDITDAVVEKIDNKSDDSQSDKYYSIKVSYKAQYDQLYDAINSYLTFDWNLSISITKEPYNFSQYVDNTNTSQEALFKRGEAYLDTSSTLPVINIPLADPQTFKDDILDTVKKTDSSDDSSSTSSKKLSLINTFAEDSTDSSEEDSEPTTDDYIYIVNNWVDLYDITKAVESSNYYSDATNNVLYKLNTTDLSSMFADYDESDTSKVCEILKLDYSQYCPDLSNITNTAVLQRVINTFAKIEAAKLNSTSYKYKISLLNESYISTNSSDNGENSIAALVEQLKDKGTLVFSSLIIATICAFVLIALFLTLNFGVASILGLSCGSAVTLLSASMLSLFGVEFNIGTIVGLIAVAIVSIISSVVYFKKVREMCYAGKNLKKACSDANKKTILFHLDISVVTLILGIVAYLFDNYAIMSLGAILIIGGILNFLFSTFVLKGIYWLLANSSFIADHLKLLMIKKEIIPDLSKDEKPTYFDSFKQEEPKKKNKIINLSVFGILLLASIIAIPTVTAVKGNVYGKEQQTVQNSEVYITYKVLKNDDNQSGIASNTELEELVLNKIYTYSESATDNKGSKLSYSSLNSVYYSTIIDDEGNTYLDFTHIIELNSKVSTNDTFIYSEDGVTRQGALNDVIKDVVFEVAISQYDKSISGIDNDSRSVYLLTSYNYSNDSLSYDIFVFIAIGISICTGYILLRYGLGKAMISLLVVITSSVISIGLYSMLLVGAASTNTLSLALIAVVGYAMILYYFSSQRELIKDNKNLKLTNKEKLDEMLRTNHSLIFSTLLICLSLSSLILISFILSKSFTNVVIISALLGNCISIIFIKCFVQDLQKVNEKCWARTKKIVKFDSFKKKNKKKDAKKNDDGPQEAIFIGIND